MTEKQRGSTRGARLAEFARRVGKIVAIDLAAALVVWVVLSLFRGFGSPVGTIMLFSLPLFGLAVVPVFFDVGRMISVPVKALRKDQDESVQEMMSEIREKSDRGMSQTFLYATAGLVVVLIGFALAVVFGP